MSTKECAEFLDGWLVESYEGAQEAVGRWRRTARKKGAAGMVRTFDNKSWELTVSVLQTPGGHIEVLEAKEPAAQAGAPSAPSVAPNGWIFGISPKGSGSPILFVTNEELAFDNVGNNHSGDCGGHLPLGIYEECESRYESSHGWGKTVALMKAHGFVHEQGQFQCYFADFEPKPAKAKKFSH